MTKRWRMAAGLLAVALVAAACGGGTPQVNAGSGGGNGSAVAKEGGVLRLGTDSGIDSLNPFVAFSQDSYSAWTYMYPTLAQYDTNTYKDIPNFATSWSSSTDGLTWTFHTIPNAKWSDGQPLTANDAAWTLNLISKFQNGPTGGWAGTVAHVTSVTAPDPNTLVAVYKRPVANVISNLGFTPILPEHVWAKYATGNGKGLKLFPNAPVGGRPVVSGGPFILTKYQKQQVALFQRNPTFYGPKAHVDGFGLQMFSSPDAMIQALKSGGLDAVEGVPTTDVATLKAAKIHVFDGPALEFRDFIINSNPKKPQHRELLNPQVRQAFEYAIDRDQIVKVAWLGYASPGSTIVPPASSTGGIQWHDSSIKPLPFDLAKANQILDSLGYTKGSNGVRTADGHPMTYSVIFAHDETGAGDRSFQIIQNDFRQIGVQLAQKPMDDTAAFNAITAPGETGYLNFDLAMWDWIPGMDPDFILMILGCDQYGNWSDTGYCNQQYDQLYQAQGAAIDPQQRKQIVDQMQQIIYNDRPYIVLSYDHTLDAWTNQWTGFVESTQGLFNDLSVQSLTQVHQV